MSGSGGGAPFRVIEGGRTGEPTPGLLITGASEVVTMTGGVRRGPEQGVIGRIATDDPNGPNAPVVACWDGRILAVGSRLAVEASLGGGGYPLARFARLDAGGGAVTPGLIDPHTHLLFAGSREDRSEERRVGKECCR